MAKLISNFQRLTPLLQKVIHSDKLTEKDRQILTKFQNSPTYGKLPQNAEEAESTNKISLFLLRKTTDALIFLSVGDTTNALQAVAKTQKLRLGIDPFRGLFHYFAAKVAEMSNSEDTKQVFENRYTIYQENFTLKNALLGAAYLQDSKVRKFLDELGENLEHQLSPYTDVESPLNEPVVEEFALPLAQPILFGVGDQESKEHPNIMVFTKPKLAQYISFDSKLIEFESDEEFMELAFDINPDIEAAEMLKHLQKEGLTIRLIHCKKKRPWSFSGQSIAEIGVSYNRLLITLEMPHDLSGAAKVEIVNWKNFGLVFQQ